MNTNLRYTVRRRGARLASGIAGAVFGLGIVASVVQGLGGRSAGQSLGDFMAQQRAIATSPLAQAAPADATAVATRRANGV